MDLSQGVPIQIHLETFVTQGEDNETHVFDEPGTWVQMGNALYIRYQEVDEDAGTSMPVTMKLREDGDVQLSRGSSNGDTQLKLFFANEKRVLTRYRTPYGIIPVETVTPRIDVRMTTEPVAGEVYIEYQLFANNQHLGDYRLRLQFNA